MDIEDTLNDRLTGLECKLTFQQETIDALNDAVTSQWQHIDQLKKQLEKLTDQMVSLENDLVDSGTFPGNEPPPPHY